MRKLLLSTYFILLLFVAGIAQQAPSQVISPSEDGLVKWLDFAQADSLYKIQPKPFLIDFYTDWCGWCKHMMRTTYSDPEVANYVNTNFYPIKFNAETGDTIKYNGGEYVKTGTGKRDAHELAIKLLGGRLSYPSTLFVSNNYQFNLLSQGYLESKALLPLLVFTVENAYRNSDYEVFKTNFHRTFYDTTTFDSEIKWYSMSEALELQKTKPKKMIVDIHTSFCNSCKVMNKTTFSSDSLAKYINDNYYLVDFNAESKDTIVFNGVAYYNDGTTSFPFHPLAKGLTLNRFELPSLVFLDESLKIIDIIPFYISEKTLAPIVHYFGDDIYKATKWEEFRKEWQQTNKD